MACSRSAWLVTHARFCDGSVEPVNALGPMLLVQTLRALEGLDGSILHALPDVPIEATDVEFVEARQVETVIHGRPWIPHRRVATVTKGTRLAVRGQVASRDAKGCGNKPWYAVLPLGFVCSAHVRPATTAPISGPALPLREGDRLPHSYVLVREDGVPLYRDRDAILSGEVERYLTKGMSLVADRSIEVDGMVYLVTASGGWIPKESLGWMGQGSPWHGVRLEDVDTGPMFAWVTKKGAAVFDRDHEDATKTGTLSGRSRVPLWERSGDWWKVGENQWVQAEDLNEVHIVVPPEGVVTDSRRTATGNDQWIDVDVGEQVLVAYRGPTAVFATLISSGRGSPTPLGNYPVWAKVTSIDMSNQDYEDHPYLVEGVPWVMLFQGHIALHGAYWHDDFGRRKSHGCVNLAPADARWLFEWVRPGLKHGWTGYLPRELTRSPVVHVRNSAARDSRQFMQEREWGPPDPKLEQEKLLAAERRRAVIPEEEAERLDPVFVDAPF